MITTKAIDWLLYNHMMVRRELSSITFICQTSQLSGLGGLGGAGIGGDGCSLNFIESPVEDYYLTHEAYQDIVDTMDYIIATLTPENHLIYDYRYLFEKTYPEIQQIFIETGIRQISTKTLERKVIDIREYTGKNLQGIEERDIKSMIDRFGIEVKKRKAAILASREEGRRVS